MKSIDFQDKLSTCYTGVVYDIMRSMKLSNFTLPKDIIPLFPAKVLCGPAYNIEGKVSLKATQHDTLFQWTGLLSKAKANHIWVSQPNDNEVAHMGELSAETLQRKGIKGCLIDGGIRDTNFLLKIGFQAWSKFHTPKDIVGHWLPTSVDEPIIIGDVKINPGDFLLGDRDGMLRIPLSYLEEVTKKSLNAMTTENKVRTAILNGEDPQQAYLKFGKF